GAGAYLAAWGICDASADVLGSTSGNGMRSVDPLSWMHLLRTLAALGIVSALAILGIRLLARYDRLRPRPTEQGNGGRLALLETITLDDESKLFLVRVGEAELVIEKSRRHECRIVARLDAEGRLSLPEGSDPETEGPHEASGIPEALRRRINRLH
ncbi:MAG: hypothetical protein KDD44_03420, partial [Bdellovibrionales bacterium]|nr:hypothetical protein [Bdellovibrionales bacterium]